MFQTFGCKGCGHVLGNHDGRRFIAGGSEFTFPLTIRCTNCGKETQWRPSPQVGAETVSELIRRKRERNRDEA